MALSEFRNREASQILNGFAQLPQPVPVRIGLGTPAPLPLGDYANGADQSTVEAVLYSLSFVALDAFGRLSQEADRLSQGMWDETRKGFSREAPSTALSQSRSRLRALPSNDEVT